jgi:hypothetical protein
MALALPVIAMADGVDNCQDRALPSWPAQQSGDFSCLATDQRNLAITYENNVVATTTGTNGRPEHVSPLATGIRMQGVFTGDADGVSSFYEQILLTGLYSQWDGNWTHIFWFSENSDDRSAEVYATNDEEVRVSCSAIPMPNELHGYVYADEDNRVYDLIEGFTIETLNTDKWFGDACLTQNGIPNNRDPESNQCAEICGVGDIWQYPSGRGDLPDGFTAHAPGIGTMEYWLTAGPFDTSTAMAFSFLSDLDWDRDYNVPVGSDMEIYSGGYQIMQELGGFKGP